MNPISPERDYRNKQLIARLFSHPWQVNDWEGSMHQRLVDHGSPEERSDFVKRQMKKYALFAAGFAVIFGILYLFPSQPVQQTITPPVITSAGTLTSLQLHETALSTSTTVVTSTGTYQVRGAVSGAPGDSATLKKEKSGAAPETTSLCLEAAAKSACYHLL